MGSPDPECWALLRSQSQAVIKWPQDWNRPLSEEELEIAKRLDRAPDDGEGTLERMGEVVSDLNARLSDQCPAGDFEKRWREDAPLSPERAWSYGQCSFADGDG